MKSVRAYLRGVTAISELIGETVPVNTEAYIQTAYIISQVLLSDSCET